MECKACSAWFSSSKKTELCSACERAMERLGFKDVEYSRLRKLMQADREGRCAILPAKEYTDKDGEKALKNAMFVCCLTNNAVNRYTADAIAEKLTREAAEKALEMEDK